jgi:hypothetical protein
VADRVPNPATGASKVSSTARSSEGTRENSHIGDPVLLSACQARFDILNLEVGSSPPQARRIEVFNGVDVDDGVELMRDLTDSSSRCNG